MPTFNTRPTWSWTSQAGTEGSGVFRYRLNSENYSLPLFGNSFTTNSDLPNGFYSLFVQELGTNGFFSDTGQFTIEINVNQLREPLLTSNDAPLTINDKPTWSWTSQSGIVGSGVYQYRINGSGYSSEMTITSFTPALPFEDGTYTFYVREKGDNGSWSSESSLTLEVKSDKTGNVAGFIKFLAIGESATEIRTTDYNNDGKTDVIYIDGLGNIKIYLNSTGIQFLLSGANASLIKLGDYNNDSKTDVIFTNNQGDLSVYVQNEGPKSLLTSKLITDIELTDYDNDSKLDTVFLDVTGDVYVYFNNE